MTQPTGYTSHTRRFGALTMTASTTPGGYGLNVFIGAQRISELCWTTPDRAALGARWCLIRDAALAGHSVEQIAEAIHGPARAVVAAAEQIVRTAAANPLDKLTGLVVRTQVGPTLAGRVVTPITPVQVRALQQAATAGRVYRGGRADEATTTTLTACARNGWLTLTAKAGTRRANWAYGEITPAGRAALNRAGVKA